MSRLEINVQPILGGANSRLSYDINEYTDVDNKYEKTKKDEDMKR